MTLLQSSDADIAGWENLAKGHTYRLIAGPSLSLAAGTEVNGSANTVGTWDSDRATVLRSEFHQSWYTRPTFPPSGDPTQNANAEAESPAIAATLTPDVGITVGFTAILLESSGQELSAFNSMGGPTAAIANSAANTLTMSAADYSALIGQTVPFVLSTDGGELPTGLGTGLLYGLVDNATTITPVTSATDNTPIDFTADGSSLYFHPAQGRLMRIESLDTPKEVAPGAPYSVTLTQFFAGVGRGV